MPKIIISYRRADSQDIAMRIRDRLAAHYGKKSIFTDIDSIPIGSDFLLHINAELANCDALLAVVGPRWLQGGREPGSGIEEETDYVRLEVEGALKRDIPVVPVIVGGGRMPKPADLPESIRAFAYRNAAAVDSGLNFQNDMDRLVRSLDEHFAARTPERAPKLADDEFREIEKSRSDLRQAAIDATRAREPAIRRDDAPLAIPEPAMAAFNAARRAVPVLDFVLVIAGIGAIAALVIGFLGYARASLVIFGGILVAGFLVIVGAQFLADRNSARAPAGVVTVSAAALLLVVFLAFTASAIAFKWPSGWASVLGFAGASQNVRTAAAICSRPDEETAVYSCGHTDGDYIVINIHSDDFDHGLVMRDHPGTAGIQVGLIPPNGTDIYVGSCESNWCPVQCKGRAGWSRERYLAKRAGAVHPVKGINPNDPDGLIVRSGPNQTCRSSGSLRSNGGDVILHGCEVSPIDQTMWCRITVNRISGWIPAENLGP